MHKIAGYEIQERIGSGGSAHVYRAATDEGMAVALKVLRDPELDPGRVERFQREAELLARLDHPGLVRVLDWGEANGEYYIVTELFEGSTLLDASELGAASGSPGGTRQGGRLSWLLRRFEEVARTLGYLHERGIIHRDVKPENIFIDNEGHARLGDLGIARDEGQHTITYDGEFLGTPHYVSPEQAMAGRVEIDHRSDIYSLGVSLFHSLTGEQPFDAGSYKEVLKNVLLANPPLLRKVAPELSSDLEAIVGQCMEKDSAHRYSSASALADDLRRIRNYQAVTARRPQRLRRALRWLRLHRTKVLLGVVVVAIAGVGILQFLLREEMVSDWIRVTPTEVTGDTAVRVRLVPLEGEGGRPSSIVEFVPDWWTGELLVPPFTLFRVQLEKDGLEQELYHVFMPKRAAVFSYKWESLTPEEQGFVRVPAAEPFYVRPEPLLLREVVEVLEAIDPEFGAARLGKLGKGAAWVGDELYRGDMLVDRAEPIEGISFDTAQVVATALGCRLLTHTEWVDLRNALAEGLLDSATVEENKLREILLQSPAELVTSLVHGVGKTGAPVFGAEAAAMLFSEYRLILCGPSSVAESFEQAPTKRFVNLEYAVGSSGRTILLGRSLVEPKQ